MSKRVDNGMGCALLVLALYGVTGTAHARAHSGVCAQECGYWGLSYSPAWHRITDFSVGANDGSTAARYPYIRNSGTYIDSNFNWHVQDARIRFNDSKLWAIEASLGYRKNFGRVELEVGFEKFNTRATQTDEDNKVTEIAHLLAKDLAHGVMSGNTDKLSKALAETSPHDIVAFAQTVGRQAKTVDGKVCNKKVAWNGVPGLRYGGAYERHGTWSCIDFSGTYGQTDSEQTAGLWSLSARFGSSNGYDIKREDNKRINTDRHVWQWTNRGWPGTAEGKINTAQGMAA